MILINKIDYKREYKEAYEFTKRSLNKYSPNDISSKKQFVSTRIESKKLSDKFKWTGEHYWKNIIANAQYNAIKDHQKECHKKGFTIYGRKIKK